MVKLTTVLAHASGQVDRVGLTGLRALSDVAKRHRMGMALNYARRYSRFFPSSVSQAKMISTRPTPRDRGNDRRSGGSVCERSQLKRRARSPKRRCWMRRRSHHCDVHRFETTLFGGRMQASTRPRRRCKFGQKLASHQARYYSRKARPAEESKPTETTAHGLDRQSTKRIVAASRANAGDEVAAPVNSSRRA
jgi:hypothetical protein